MASKLPQGGNIEIPGVSAAQSLQDAIGEIRMLRDRKLLPARPEGSFTAKEYAKQEGMSESTAKKAHLYPLVESGDLEVIRYSRPTGGIVNLYRKKTTEIEINPKRGRSASNGHALDTDKGRRGK